MPGRGPFISFEGIDGAGKSTHIQTLAQAFEAQGRAVALTREPGGTPLAETLRELVLHQPMDGTTEALLVFAARRDHLRQRIEPALARGEVVLSDRFTDASFAYQGFGRGLDLKLLYFLERLVQTTQGLGPDFVRQPDLTLWFDLDPALAAARLEGVRTPDKFESQSTAFFERVRSGYLHRMQADPQRFVRIGADQTRQAVGEAVLRAVRDRGWL